MTLPIIGDSIRFVMNPVALQQQRYKQYGDFYETSLFGSSVVNVADPAAVRKLIASEHNLVEANFVGPLELMLGSGSVSCTHGQQHLKLRRALNPAFAPGKILEYVPTIVDICHHSIDRWLRLGSFKGRVEMMTFPFEVAVKLILGFDEVWLEDSKLAVFREAFKDWTEALFSPLPVWTRFIPGTTLHKGMKARRLLIAAISENLERIRAEQESSGTRPKQEGSNVARVLLSLEGEEGRILKQSALHDQCLNILWAGYETTSSALTLILQRLKQYPAVLEKVREEQRQIISRHGNGFNGDVLKELTYTDAVVKESLRYNSIVGGLFRKALRDFELGPYRIPKGQALFLGIGRVMREVDERWKGSREFPLSDFLPERWLSDEGRTAGAWVAFGGGVRQCLGMNFALVEMKILIALLARRCEWEVDVQEPLRNFPIPCPANDLPMKLWPLQK